MDKYIIYKVTKTPPPPPTQENKSSSMEYLNKEEIKYLPCSKLLEVYINCLEEDENNCDGLLVNVIKKCGN